MAALTDLDGPSVINMLTAMANRDRGSHNRSKGASKYQTSVPAAATPLSLSAVVAASPQPPAGSPVNLSRSLHAAAAAASSGGQGPLSASPPPGLTPLHQPGSPDEGGVAPIETEGLEKNGVNYAKPPPRNIGKPIHVPYTPDLRARPSSAALVHTHAPAKAMVLRDYQLLAEACQRAGKARMEGHAYYKIGELLARHRNLLSQAVKYFKKYLNICRRLNDLQGEAKALNCIGIAKQELADSENLHRALEFHSQHAEISDAAGIFIANTNIGLIYGTMNHYARAVEHHKIALQHAVRAGDRQAEALALANLGYMARNQGDLNTAKICMERHLELATSLKDDAAASQAYEELGMLTVERGEHEEAVKLFMQSMTIAQKQGDQTKANLLKCHIGIVNGNVKMDEHMRTIARNMGAKAERKGKKGPADA